MTDPPEETLDAIETIIGLISREVNEEAEIEAADVYQTIGEIYGSVDVDDGGWPNDWSQVEAACEDLGYFEPIDEPM